MVDVDGGIETAETAPSKDDLLISDGMVEVDRGIETAETAPSKDDLPVMCRDKFGFYYGFVVLIVGTLGICSSMPGQTVGVSVFSESIMAALRLSRSQLALAYLCGTISSSFLLPLAGKVLDRVGPRKFTVFASVFLASFIIYLSYCDIIAATINSKAPGYDRYVGFGVAYVGFFGIRHFGQGWMTLGGRTMIANWFSKHRGRMMAVSGLGVAFVFGVAPLMFEILINKFGWRSALKNVLAGYLLAFGLVALIFYRKSPSDCGVAIDGGDANDEESIQREKEAGEKGSFTAEEALKTRAFWLYASGLTAHAMITTGCTFHIAYIASLNGVGEQKAFSVFFPAAVMSTVADMVGGFLQECVDMRWLLATQGASMCLFIVGLVNFHTSWGYWLLAVGQGISGGMFAQLQGTSWPNLFGLAHLGAIGGYTMSLVVAGSALGPYSFTLSLGGRGGDELQNFNHNLYVLGILPLVVLLLSPFASKPTRGNHSTLGKYELVEMGDGEGDENDRV